MKMGFLTGAAICAIGIASGTSGQANAQPIVIIDDPDGAVCDFDNVGARIYRVVGDWPNAMVFVYECNGRVWEIVAQTRV